MSDDTTTRISRVMKPNDQLAARVSELTAERDALERICRDMERDVCQTLGKALGYPWHKDDQENFPGTTEAHGVCVGEHTSGSIADEAAEKIRSLEAENAELRRTPPITYSADALPDSEGWWRWRESETEDAEVARIAHYRGDWYIDTDLFSLRSQNGESIQEVAKRCYGLWGGKVEV